jgi:hypothetical protein
VSPSVSVSGCPTPLVSSEGSSSSSPLEPFDFETQYSLEANYLASLLTSEYLNRFVAPPFFFLFYVLTDYFSISFFFFFFFFLGYTTQERIAAYYAFRRHMDAHLSNLEQDDQYRILPPHRDN